jgi:histidinol-phosphate aminotransferase
MEFNLSSLLRDNIRNIKPYASARDEFTGIGEVYLDANENPFETGLNRYPDPHHQKLKSVIAKIKNVRQDRILFGNGSDEVIDLLYRALCTPGKDDVIITPPTYGMYQVYADINDIRTTAVELTPETFQLNVEGILKAITPNTKIIWCCSPNNPTGNALEPEDILALIKGFKGIVVVDEAYIDFSSAQTWLDFLDLYPNLFVMQTLSKAWGLAGIRLGMGFGNSELISVLHKIKPPYNINTLSQEKALERLALLDEKNEEVDQILFEREAVQLALEKLPSVQKVYPSEANFLMIKLPNATDIYNSLIEKGIIVRNRANVKLCTDCLRITIGTKAENLKLLASLEQIIQNSKQKA